MFSVNTFFSIFIILGNFWTGPDKVCDFCGYFQMKRKLEIDERYIYQYIIIDHLLYFL